MKTWKVVLAVFALGLLIAGGVFWNTKRSSAPVHVTIRIHVSPADQVEYVLTKANSARFKYVLGKTAQTKAYLAQNVELTSTPNQGIIEAKVGVQTEAEAKVYANDFADALQVYCGPKVKLSVDAQRIQ